MSLKKELNSLEICLESKYSHYLHYNYEEVV